MPSVHVGWALIVALAVITVSRSRWRWLAAGYPLLTLLVVVVTANHFWLDGVAAAVLVAAALAAQRLVRQHRGVNLPEAPRSRLCAGNVRAGMTPWHLIIPLLGIAAFVPTTPRSRRCPSATWRRVRSWRMRTPGSATWPASTGLSARCPAWRAGLPRNARRPPHRPAGGLDRGQVVRAQRQVQRPEGLGLAGSGAGSDQRDHVVAALGHPVAPWLDARRSALFRSRSLRARRAVPGSARGSRPGTEGSGLAGRYGQLARCLCSAVRATGSRKRSRRCLAGGCR